MGVYESIKEGVYDRPSHLHILEGVHDSNRPSHTHTHIEEGVHDRPPHTTHQGESSYSRPKVWTPLMCVGDGLSWTASLMIVCDGLSWPPASLGSALALGQHAATRTLQHERLRQHAGDTS
jgi:hypothetical protein